jgi:hypothetical protein
VPIIGDVVASDSTVDPADLQVFQNLMASRSGDGNATPDLGRPTHDNVLVGRTAGPFLGLIALLRRLRGRVPIFGREDAEDPVEKVMQNLGLSDADLEQMMMIQTRRPATADCLRKVHQKKCIILFELYKVFIKSKKVKKSKVI